MARIPISYNDLTIKQFMECKEIEAKHLDLMARRMALVSYFTGKDANTMILNTPKWKPWKLSLRYALFRVDLLLASKITDKIKSSVWIGFKKYKSITDATKLNVNQATGMKELGKNTNANFHRIAGLIFYRGSEFKLKDWDKVSDELLKAKVGEVAPAVFFYSKVSERLNQILPSFFLTNNLMIEKEIKELMKTTRGPDLSKVMVGSIQ